MIFWKSKDNFWSSCPVLNVRHTATTCPSSFLLDNLWMWKVYCTLKREKMFLYFLKSYHDDSNWCHVLKEIEKKTGNTKIFIQHSIDSCIWIFCLLTGENVINCKFIRMRRINLLKSNHDKILFSNLFSLYPKIVLFSTLLVFQKILNHEVKIYTKSMIVLQ